MKRCQVCLTVNIQHNFCNCLFIAFKCWCFQKIYVCINIYVCVCIHTHIHIHTHEYIYEILYGQVYGNVEQEMHICSSFPWKVTWLLVHAPLILCMWLMHFNSQYKFECCVHNAVIAPANEILKWVFWSNLLERSLLECSSHTGAFFINIFLNK